jgi:hypothetical protein
MSGEEEIKRFKLCKDHGLRVTHQYDSYSKKSTIVIDADSVEAVLQRIDRRIEEVNKNLRVVRDRLNRYPEEKT